MVAVDEALGSFCYLDGGLSACRLAPHGFLNYFGFVEWVYGTFILRVGDHPMERFVGICKPDGVVKRRVWISGFAIFWRKRALAACVTVLAGIFILVCFALMAISHLGFDKISPLKALNLPHAGWKIGSWIVTVALLCLGVNLINFVLPDVKRTWHWVTSGTAFAVLALIISSAAMNVYVKYFPSMDRIYGTLVGFIVLMLWIYAGSLILLLAAEIDHEIEKFI